MRFLLEEVAAACHAVNRKFCAAVQDPSQQSWNLAPEWQRESARKGAVLVLEQIAAKQEPDPSLSHQSWLKEKVDTGWVYGPEKNPELRTHPCIVDYEKLPAYQRVKDDLFINVVSGMVAYQAFVDGCEPDIAARQILATRG